MTKKHILSLFLPLALALCGCEHNLEHNMVPDKLGFSSTEALQTPSVFNDGMTISVIKSGKGTTAASVKIAVCTQEEVPEYEIVDPSKFEISTDELEFGTSEIRKTLDLTWNTTFFANSAKNGHDYAIALKLVDASIDVDTNRTLIIVKPVLTKVGFKLKDIKSLYPSLDDKTTIGEYEAEMNLDFAIPNQEVEVELAVDNSLIAAEASIRDKEFEAAPAGLFKFKNEKVTFEAGQTIAFFNYELNYSVLFNEEGKFKQNHVNYMIPIVISKKNPKLLGDTDITTAYITMTVSEEEKVEPQPGPTSRIHGPWEILEGADIHIGKDPKCTAADWYGNYNVSKLVDWNFFNGDNPAANGYWGSYYWTEPTFPMEFVFDTGGDYIFNEFFKVDAGQFQGQFCNFEVYTAREYAGADTDWKLAAKGETDYRGYQAYGNGSDIEAVLSKFAYTIPMDRTADGSEFNLTRGRYIKFVIVSTANRYPSYNTKGGYLMEFYAEGWQM